jgi:hypothetical protein
LRDLVNVRDEADFKLIAAFIVGCFNPRGPYPMLAVSGEQRSGKTSIVRLVRSLVDQAAAPVRSPPRDEQSLINEARSSWLLAFDNLSEIPNWLSDALCRLSTGGGFSARELYSDTGQIVFEGTRPIVLERHPRSWLTSRFRRSYHRCRSEADCGHAEAHRAGDCDRGRKPSGADLWRDPRCRRRRPAQS